MQARILPLFATFVVLASAAGAFAQNETPQGYRGAYDQAPPGTATSPPYNDPLPAIDTGTGRAIAGPDGSETTVKAAPCSTTAQETDGSTTCIGIPDRAGKDQ